MWVSYVLGQVASIFLTLGRLVPLNLLNHFGRGHIPQAGDVVISLTTHGERLKKVYLTLESLARGYVKVPIFLWLDPEDYYAPYGYIGLGEVAVFIFFGLIAVLGTEYTQADRVSWVGVCSAIAIGCISAGVNLANNIRDIPTDEASGKMTLAVRLGDQRARFLFQVLVAVPFIMSFFIAAQTIYALIALAALPLAFIAAMPVQEGKTGKDLIPVLGLTGRCMIAWAVITALVLALS